MSSVYQHSSANLRGSSSDDSLSGKKDTLFDNPFVESFICFGWVVLLFYCLLCKRTQRPNTTVGDRIRARAQESFERAQRQVEKEKQSPEERKKLVDESLRTKIVLSKDDQGVWKLGDVEDVGEVRENIDDESAKTSIDAKQSESENRDDSKLNDYAEDDHACVICLDPFLPQDVVSWSRYSTTCTHVFHSDCIRPWLEDRKQDECPSCRSVLVCYECTDGEKDTDNAKAAGNEESIFFMMHGLISQVIPRVIQSNSYNLVSVSSNSFDSEENEEEKATQVIEMMAPPSPIRRVLSENSQSPQNLSQPVEFRQVVSDLSYTTNRRGII